MSNFHKVGHGHFVITEPVDPDKVYLTKWSGRWHELACSDCYHYPTWVETHYMTTLDGDFHSVAAWLLCDRHRRT